MKAVLFRFPLIAQFQTMKVKIRPVEVNDATLVANLSHQLGYPCTAAIMERRIISLQESTSDKAWVAEDEDQIVGWIQITFMERLESGRFMEITGLVVDESRRSQGIGEQLLAFVRDIAKDQGLPRIVVRSNVLRTRTHGFYLRNGFEEKKRQCVFEQVLA
jgi:N-acetylglutamate synthase-like GNAT family acetyltransferase